MIITQSLRYSKAIVIIIIYCHRIRSYVIYLESIKFVEKYIFVVRINLWRCFAGNMTCVTRVVFIVPIIRLYFRFEFTFSVDRIIKYYEVCRVFVQPRWRNKSKGTVRNLNTPVCRG